MPDKKDNVPVVKPAVPALRKVVEYYVSPSVKSIVIGGTHFTRGSLVTVPVPQFFIDNGQVVKKTVLKK